MNRAPKFLLIFALVASAAPLDLSAWRHRKVIPVTPGDQLAAVKLDREVYSGAEPSLDDLRVLRDGIEVPYIRDSIKRQEDDVERQQELLDMSVVDGALQFTMKVGRTHHNEIRLVTEERNFRQKVRIEASEDNRHWALLRSDGAIFDFTQDSRQFSSLTVEFPVSTKPFLRVTISGWNKVADVQAAFVNNQVSHAAERETLASVSPKFFEDAQTKSTVATLDMGVEGLPIDRLVFEVGSKQFQRAVGVETSADGNDWSYVGQGVIARLPGPDFTEEDLTVGIPETHHRYLRVRIYNRDDQPLQMGRVQLEGLIRYVKFIAADAGKYWLYYGNSKVQAPSYDLPELLARRDHIAEANWTLGAAETNPLYRAPLPPTKPWSEQHPGILYTVLGGAVLALGIATFRFASKLRPSP
jgi:hypothetical protein